MFSFAPTILASAAPVFLFQDTFSRTGSLVGSSPEYPPSASYINYYPTGAAGAVNAGDVNNPSTTNGLIVSVDVLSLPATHTINATVIVQNSEYVGIGCRTNGSVGAFAGIYVFLIGNAIQIVEATSPSSASVVYTAALSYPISTAFDINLAVSATAVIITIPSIGYSYTHTSSFLASQNSLGFAVSPAVSANTRIMQVNAN